jgi:hypothetical protein
MKYSNKIFLKNYHRRTDKFNQLNNKIAIEAGSNKYSNKRLKGKRDDF